ncbi:MAG: hypothetical protein IT378_16935 [Sandaracinaceae bacterium]|nr:hypothetical protein [Sandaracinaceae bacterium]
MAVDGITTSLDEWPIVVHTTVGIPSEQDVRAFVERADALLLRRERHVVVFDNSQAGRVPSYLRDASTEWLARNRDALERHCAGSALVLRSPALRFVMSTVLLVSSHAVIKEVFGTREEAMAWARRTLAQQKTASG